MPVITFSRFFPKDHPKAGEPTNFVEKILKSIIDNPVNDKTKYVNQWRVLEQSGIILADIEEVEPRHHTIRVNRKDGKLWKPGDTFSPRIWSGKPYSSKQITFAPDIEVKKVWDFLIKDNNYLLSGEELMLKELTEVAKNDGLSADDFEAWFACHPKKKGETTHCQILCWNEAIEYVKPSNLHSQG